MILRILILLLFATVASAEPYLTCDPEPDADGYVLTFTDVELVVEAPTVEGAIWWDMATWTHGHGWFDGRASFTQSYEVIDGTTFLSTEVTVRTGSSPFRMKIPNKKAPANYKVLGQK